MYQHEQSPTHGLQDAPPLTIPPELWSALPEEQRTVFSHAQRVLDVLEDQRPATLRDLTFATQLSAEGVLFALRALDAMNLVSVGTDGRHVTVRLLAVPDEHVPLTAPDGSRRWLFVARPLTPPDVDAAMLN
jgi:hypothetical protein